MPIGHEEYLNDLKRQRDEKRRELERLQAELKRINDAVEALERLHAAAPVPAGPSIIVDTDQFKNTPANYALAAVMLANPSPHRARELADALYRGGQGADATKILTMVKHHLKSWRNAKYAELDQPNHTWTLTAEGREALGKTHGQRAAAPSSQAALALQR